MYWLSRRWGSEVKEILQLGGIPTRKPRWLGIPKVDASAICSENRTNHVFQLDKWSDESNIRPYTRAVCGVPMSLAVPQWLKNVFGWLTLDRILALVALVFGVLGASNVAKNLAVA
ncbi:MAG: hypothetical protein DMG96_30845 [Acidobacteria bacterium]|nr:MAG: hypothetical protein DMG96_30845 [Acidobacteriota bacterium]